jgi:uncharacterized membrane protein YgcG
VARTPFAIATATAHHWASVSAAPDTDPQAQQEVLGALDTTASPRLDDHLRAPLGHRTVTATEVERALKKMRRGTSPGLDGIPLEFYSHCSSTLSPILARLFTALWTLEQPPRNFHLGVITVLFKSGAACDPANYRPITLLGTDYRIFAKILTLRLRPLLPLLIDPEQTAFVAGRRIGDNIMLLQLLPHCLDTTAYVVFCDFAKAYDTLDRSFLFAVLEHVGLGSDFIAIVKLLLSDTRACARVNGGLSRPHSFHAGVRQGCPLAPLLYLFIGQALQRWLRCKGVGISLSQTSSLLSALQYADDTEVFLSSLSQVHLFKNVMDVFGRATAQRLHPGKTKILPVGRSPPLPPLFEPPYQVVDEAKALGVTFRRGTQQPAPDWAVPLATVEACFDRSAGLGLSAMGRGVASAAYGVSRLLFQAEFNAVDGDVCARLDRMVRRLVLEPTPRHNNGGDGGGGNAGSSSGSSGAGNSNSSSSGGSDGSGSSSSRGQSAAWARRGKRLQCRAQLLWGSPREGGWGVLPWREHCLARHAWWGGRMFDPAAQVQPWVRLARSVLRTYSGSSLSTPLLPPPLARIVSALERLPAPSCLPVAGGGSALAADMRAAAGAMPLAWLLPKTAAGRDQAHYAVFDGTPSVGLLAGQLARWQADLPVGHTARVKHDRAQRLEQQLPPSWLAAAGRQPGGSSVVSWVAAMQHVAAWEFQAGEELALVRPWQLSVRSVTRLLVASEQQRHRGIVWQRYADLIGGGASAADVGALLVRAWRAPVDNTSKEVVWLLACDALLTPGRMRGSSTACCCGAPMPGVLHYFWECPAAVTLRELLQRCLSPSSPPLAREHIWLARPPSGQAEGPWLVVALAALSALEHVRCVGVRSALSRTAPHRRLLPDGAGRRAIAHFWASVSSFCSLDLAPPSWRSMCCAFFYYVPGPLGPTANGGSGWLPRFP